jgi:hypothetical protein
MDHRCGCLVSHSNVSVWPHWRNLSGLGVREREDGFGPHQEAFWREDAYADVSTAPILIGTVFETHSYLRHSFSLSHLGCDCVYCLVVEKLVECEDLILD